MTLPSPEERGQHSLAHLSLGSSFSLWVLAPHFMIPGIPLDASSTLPHSRSCLQTLPYVPGGGVGGWKLSPADNHHRVRPLSWACPGLPTFGWGQGWFKPGCYRQSYLTVPGWKGEWGQGFYPHLLSAGQQLLLGGASRFWSLPLP